MSFLKQCPSVRHLEALDGKISDRQEQIELCNMILNDLLEIQKIVAVGFCFIEFVLKCCSQHSSFKCLFW